MYTMKKEEVLKKYDNSGLKTEIALELLKKNGYRANY